MMSVAGIVVASLMELSAYILNGTSDHWQWKFAMGTLPFAYHIYFIYGLFSTLSLCLIVTCNWLDHRFEKIAKHIDNSNWQYRGRPVPVIQILEQFDDSCKRVYQCNSFWKKMLFIFTVGNTVMVAAALVMVMEMPFPAAVSSLMLVLTIAYGIITSAVILSPAHVHAAARRLHPVLCSSIAKGVGHSRHERIKLVNAIKRFDAPIAFTLYDTNALDYMDYFTVTTTLRSLIWSY